MKSRPEFGNFPKSLWEGLIIESWTFVYSTTPNTREWAEKLGIQTGNEKWVMMTTKLKFGRQYRGRKSEMFFGNRQISFIFATQNPLRCQPVSKMGMMDTRAFSCISHATRRAWWLWRCTLPATLLCTRSTQTTRLVKSWATFTFCGTTCFPTAPNRTITLISPLRESSCHKVPELLNDYWARSLSYIAEKRSAGLYFFKRCRLC